MPELPEVETTRRGIAPHVLGRRVSQVCIRQPRLRWPVPGALTEILPRRKLMTLNRRGKYLLLGFTHGTLILHLGMSGSLRVLPRETPAEKHDHFDLIFGPLCLRLHDPRRFGAVLWTEQPVAEHPLLAHLGPEPLGEAFTGRHLFDQSRNRKVTVKQFIMDGRTVVGVGNIYANEALFRAGISPMRACGRISAQRYERLARSIKDILTTAIECGGTTLQDFLQADGKPGYFSQELQVYGHAGEPCPVCTSIIRHRLIGQRSSYYCSRCQH
ncbi:bifunctional DNA-formamidopyrimidine glycosylase/DNA-(apurinic or apyrimidinic site) lyase [Thiolapillus brandeum]|uniref:Formamidopyrimidine-DNA glycosylase n=1 Tax=Thiolapillus brandeum TaxID=1076588 RepID=A0A7U6GKD8_9GAMM|nr:bifunctional DNA-formamidopyrimidine glycosylase/DNA-(apurinic or apyrimidinic site) lyase [Thiolapillus brandeum]BAO45228.1 formamidopyrimidine-DNA glycosylase [Thiolapillus brandeum]